ncbi:Ribosomal RNA small subunit methyltransferase H, partial [Frankliniella fusca]
MDPARDYTVKSTRNWSSFQLFSTPSSCTFPEASFRVQFDGAHRFSRLFERNSVVPTVFRFPVLPIVKTQTFRLFSTFLDIF